MEVVYLIVGAIAGFAIAYFFLKSRSAADVSSATQRADMLQNSLTESRQDLKAQSDKLEALLREERNRTELATSALASAKTENENLLQRLQEQKAEIEQLNKKFAVEFENLANKILEEKSQKFTEQNRTNLDVILAPFKEKLKDFEQKVDQTYKAESAERITLKTEIKYLVELNKQVSEEANNLANALKGDNKQQGGWGEMLLEKILERSGLKEGEEFKTQFTTTNNEGDRIKPDVVVFLPDNKHVVIDSKVSLVAYNACVNSNTEEERARYLKLHIDSVRSHIKLLSEKNYQTATGLTTPDFVLLFIPIESSFSLALQGDSELFNFAWDRKIVVVSPSTLLATLRTIASIWKQERQTRNALDIAVEGGKLYDKFVAFYEDLVKVGKKMNDAKVDYDEAMKKLYQGAGNLVRRAEKMRELGAKASKQLPTTIIERSDE